MSLSLAGGMQTVNVTLCGDCKQWQDDGKKRVYPFARLGTCKRTGHTTERTHICKIKTEEEPAMTRIKNVNLEDLRRFADGGQSLKQLASCYGVSEATISNWLKKARAAARPKPTLNQEPKPSSTVEETDNFCTAYIHICQKMPPGNLILSGGSLAIIHNYSNGYGERVCNCPWCGVNLGGVK